MFCASGTVPAMQHRRKHPPPLPAGHHQHPTKTAPSQPRRNTARPASARAGDPAPVATHSTAADLPPAASCPPPATPPTHPQPPPGRTPPPAITTQPSAGVLTECPRSDPELRHGNPTRPPAKPNQPPAHHHPDETLRPPTAVRTPGPPIEADDPAPGDPAPDDPEAAVPAADDAAVALEAV